MISLELSIKLNLTEDFKVHIQHNVWQTDVDNLIGYDKFSFHGKSKNALRFKLIYSVINWTNYN